VGGGSGSEYAITNETRLVLDRIDDVLPRFDYVSVAR
jgi:hypothetical protein